MEPPNNGHVSAILSFYREVVLSSEVNTIEKGYQIVSFIERFFSIVFLFEVSIIRGSILYVPFRLL